MCFVPPRLPAPALQNTARRSLLGWPHTSPWHAHLPAGAHVLCLRGAAVWAAVQLPTDAPVDRLCLLHGGAPLRQTSPSGPRVPATHLQQRRPLECLYQQEPPHPECRGRRAGPGRWTGCPRRHPVPSRAPGARCPRTTTLVPAAVTQGAALSSTGSGGRRMNTSAPAPSSASCPTRRSWWWAACVRVEIVWDSLLCSACSCEVREDTVC
ncbi:uncharacterized protein LOC135097494 isoform X1 [Scylla paramamosain]|uniref:uncharacterized protein LOC135097494 isoform X1 n=1 Tax=Scylla paramamosain TaxID=85552 RepID=UPI003082E776